MKDKHIHIAEDSRLLKLLYQEVDKQFSAGKKDSSPVISLKFLFYFSLSCLFYTGLYQMRNPGIFILCFISYGFAVLLLAFNFAHDFSHNTVFKSKKLNHYCFITIYAIVGAHAEAWKQRHIHAHHYAPNVEEYDSDLKISKLIRVIPNSRHYWYHRYQHLYAPFAYTTYSLFWVFIKDFVILYSRSEYHEKKNVQYHCSFWVQKLFYICLTLILPLLFSMQPWYIIFAGFILMHLFQSLFLLLTFFMTHHVEQTIYPVTDANGNINCSWLMNQIRSSNDMHPFSKTANFIFGGFNNHIAHHLFPHFHHIYYPRLSRILYQLLRENGIKPNQTTYWGGIRSHLRLLKLMSIPNQS